MEEKGKAKRESWESLTFLQRDMVLDTTVRLAFKVPGHIVEFGVADGDSTRVIRRVANECERVYPAEARKRIYACDSFEGLREKFENADVGAFKTTPPKISGVRIVKGYFEDSLTPDLAKEVGTVAFASLDADLYSSTLCALRWLTPLLRTGSLLLFDEFLGEKASEQRAFEDWSKETGIRTMAIAEFVREPSGWGTALDRRMLYQVAGDDQPQRFGPHPGLKGRLKRSLGRLPAAQKASAAVRRLLR